MLRIPIATASVRGTQIVTKLQGQCQCNSSSRTHAVPEEEEEGVN